MRHAPRGEVKTMGKTPYDTSGCPPLPRYVKCAGCAEQDPEMARYAINTRYGVACAPVCPLCVDTIEADWIPDPAPVQEHARHLGIDPVVNASWIPPGPSLSDRYRM